MLQLTFNSGLTLTGFRTTRPWTLLSPARVKPLYGAGRKESSGTGLNSPWSGFFSGVDIRSISEHQFKISNGPVTIIQEPQKRRRVFIEVTTKSSADSV